MQVYICLSYLKTGAQWFATNHILVLQHNESFVKKNALNIAKNMFNSPVSSMFFIYVLHTCFTLSSDSFFPKLLVVFLLTFIVWNHIFSSRSIVTSKAQGKSNRMNMCPCTHLWWVQQRVKTYSCGAEKKANFNTHKKWMKTESIQNVLCSSCILKWQRKKKVMKRSK